MARIIEFPKGKRSGVNEERSDIIRLLNEKGLDGKSITYALERFDKYIENGPSEFNFRLELDASLSEAQAEDISTQFQNCIDSVLLSEGQKIAKLRALLIVAELNVYNLRRNNGEDI